MDEQTATSIVELLGKQGGRPRTERQIKESFSRRGLNPRFVHVTLDELADSGRIERTRKGAFRLPRPGETVIGRMLATRKGFGFVHREDGPDIYVSAQRMHGAMHHDTVEVRLLRTSRLGGESGEVIRVLERARDTLVGRYEKSGKIGLVIPSDRRINYDLVVGRHYKQGARQGDMVVARITRYPDGSRDAAGEIEEIIGNESDPNIEVDVIVREHGLRTEFGADVLAEAGAVPDEIGEAEAAGRRDYRDLFTCTIDGVDAKDFDDAVSVEREGEGYRLTVHIADVSHYAPLGGALQQEAATRGTSVYLVDRVLPMLPERLSNGICSLKPREDRLAVSVRMLVSADGKVEEYEIDRSVIRSDHRLTYEGVDEWIETGAYPDERLREYVTALLELSRLLEKKRITRGALEFETVEPKVILDEEGRPVEIVVRQETPATKIIEEAMILTNEVVASKMAKRRTPMIYRIHEDPDAETLAEIGVILEEFDYPAKSLIGATPAVYQSVIRHAHNRPEKLLINSLLLRSMKQAIYSPESGEHFGLASKHYSHFTSPIRRYPDLVVHHLLTTLLSEGRQASTELFEDLYGVAEHSSLTEREAEDAERESVDVKVCELMAGHIGEAYDGIVTGVANFGLFVQLPNTAEGLVRVNDMTDDYYVYEPERYLLRGERTGKVYRLGQAVRVRVAAVVIGERRIDLVIEGMKPSGRRHSHPEHGRI
ncbi:MAG: ribonuclease R [Actinobacteria bacterium]|nr:MAG: ribonuclease R [Actinomycetota bacterium]